MKVRFVEVFDLFDAIECTEEGFTPLAMRKRIPSMKESKDLSAIFDSLFDVYYLCGVRRRGECLQILSTLFSLHWPENFDNSGFGERCSKAREWWEMNNFWIDDACLKIIRDTELKSAVSQDLSKAEQSEDEMDCQ